MMRIIAITLLLLISTYTFAGVFAETNDTMSYQGELIFSGSPANGNFDFILKGYSALTGGDLLPTESTHLNVPVVNGLFTLNEVALDASFFGGLDVYIEVNVRQGGGNPTYTALSPRQKIHAAPYATNLISGDAQIGQVYTFGIAGWRAQDNTHFSGNFDDLSNIPADIADGDADTTYAAGTGIAIAGTTITNTGDTDASDDVTRLDDLSDAIIQRSSLFVGDGSGVNNTTNIANNDGLFNTAVGNLSLNSNISGYNNTALGASALLSNVSGRQNTALGVAALRNNTGSKNTSIGNGSGYDNVNGSGNIFIGYRAGHDETGSNKLYIENSESATPLIGGDFLTNEVVINGKLGIGIDSPDEKLHVQGNGFEVALIESTSIGGAASVILQTNNSSSNSFIIKKHATNASGSIDGITLANSSLIKSGTTAGPLIVDVASNNPMYFLTNSATNMVLEADGDLELKNNLTAPDSGDADMKAYIYGSTANLSGAINTLRSSDGFIVAQVSVGRYRVTFDTSPGNTYIVNVNVIGTSPLFATLNRSADYFDVYTWDNNGAHTDAVFNFSVFKK
jgi:hypothetical protein